MLSTQRAERANVPSCRGTCHIDTSVYILMSKHSTRVPRSEFRRGGKKKRAKEGTQGIHRASTLPVASRGGATCRSRRRQQAWGVRRTRVTPSNLMLMPVDSRDRRRHETTVAGIRRRNDYTRDSWNYAKYTAHGEETPFLLAWRRGVRERRAR